MPLLDHFRPPLSRSHPWRGFHGTWAAALARLLNSGVLPVGYYAVPFMDRDGPMEIDVAALQEAGNAMAQSSAGDGPAWSPADPELSVAVDWPSVDDVHVDVYSDEGDPVLAAAIELVSPRNKDRPPAREAFTSKCADHLRHGRGLVVVDVVTTRRADLHADLLEELGVDEASRVADSLSAVSYQPLGGAEGEGKLRAWPQELNIGDPLPTLPLWIGPDVVVPLDLEASHWAACTDLRINVQTAPAVT